jgi:hypothetical protein
MTPTTTAARATAMDATDERGVTVNRSTTHSAPGRWLAVAHRLRQRGFPDGTPAWVVVLGTLAILAGAALVASTAAIHLHLWLAGYRHVPRIGPLFIAQAITGFLLAPLLAVGRHIVVVLGAALYMAASATGLLLSANVGFLGIHDGLGVPWATTSLVIELIGATLLAVAGVTALFYLYRSALTQP